MILQSTLHWQKSSHNPCPRKYIFHVLYKLNMTAFKMNKWYNYWKYLEIIYHSFNLKQNQSIESCRLGISSIIVSNDFLPLLLMALISFFRLISSGCKSDENSKECSSVFLTTVPVPSMSQLTKGEMMTQPTETAIKMKTQVFFILQHHLRTFFF